MLRFKTSKILQFISLAFLCMSCGGGGEGDSVTLVGPSSLEIFDIDNLQNASDIRVFFNNPSEITLIEEYRIMVVPAAEVATFDLTRAEEMTAERYQVQTPGIRESRLNLSAELLDINGENVESGAYSVVILAIPKNPDNSVFLSQPSNSLQLTDAIIEDIYVSSRNTNSVEVFDGVTEEHVISLVPRGTRGLNATQDVLFDKDDNLLVSGRGNKAIFKFDPLTRQFLGFFTTGYDLDNPTKMSFGPQGDLYVSQWGTSQNAVARFDGETGEFKEEIISSLPQGCDHAWDSQGNMYTVSFALKTLAKYTSEGVRIGTVVGPSVLTSPVNLWIDDSKDEVVVMDWNGAAGKKFRLSTGAFIRDIYTGVNGEGFAMRGDELFIGDWPNDRILKMDINTGNILSRFGAGKLTAPNGIAFGPNLRPL